MVGNAALNHALQTAVKAALQGPRTGGNPQVGAALLDADGRIISVGYHRGRGTVHAEVDCLASLPKETDPATLTLVVTLEPCNHHGLTPPCAALILAKGIGTVYYAVADPNPNAAGGAQFLSENGVQTYLISPDQVSTPVWQNAQELTVAWRQAVQQRRPWVIAKVAQTLDGYVAAADGTSQWITGKLSRAHAHKIRGTVDSIVVGTGTALADRPELSARTSDQFLLPHQPKRFVLGKRELPADSPLCREVRGWRPGDFHAEMTNQPGLTPVQAREQAQAAGRTPASTGDSPATQVQHHHLCRFLEERFEAGDRFLLLEGGPTLVSAALAANLVNELHIYQAPKLLGAGRAGITGLGITTLAEAREATEVSYQPLGRELWIRLVFAVDGQPIPTPTPLGDKQEDK